jgi:hypothetical protein
MAIPKNDEARRGTYHGAGGVKMYPGDNEYEGDNHGEILHEEKNDEWHSDVEIAIVEGVYLRGMNIRGQSRVGRWIAYRVR